MTDAFKQYNNSGSIINNECGKIDAALLQDYLEDIIDPVEKLFVEEHLNSCRSCRRELSELKLMYWELGNRSNYEIEYPKELNEMCTGLVDRVIGVEEKSTAKKVIEVQLNNVRNTKKFLEYIPGAKQTPGMLKKASKSLAKGVGTGVKKGVKRMLEAK